MKKPFYKKWWYWAIAAALGVGGLGGIGTETAGTVIMGVVGCIAMCAAAYWGYKRDKNRPVSFDTAPSTPEAIEFDSELEFRVAGVYYHKANINKLATRNKDWRMTAAQMKKSGFVDGKRIYRYTYVNKPVKLIPDPENEFDPDAIQVIVAGELVGYVPEDMTGDVRRALAAPGERWISAFIGGGDYKYLDEDGDIQREEGSVFVNIRIKSI